jgi:DtxR family Mn-dependent transcriptional regulator
MTGETRATATVEEYLEAILNMISEGRKVLAVHLVERLLVSPPTVTATFRRMRRDGLITANERKEISLTEKGLKLATNIVRGHRLAERLLTDILNIPWHEAHHEACLLEHGISNKVMESLYQTLGQPSTCPHGNPIPLGNTLRPLQGIPLNTVPAGETVVVERISEETTRQVELMKYLGEAGIKPGTRMKVREVADYAGIITLLVGDSEFSLATKVAALVWVMPSPSS